MTTTIDSNRQRIRRSRGPNGASLAKRTFVALLPHERDELERLAELECRTCSAMARIYLVRSMKVDPNFREEVADES